MDFCLESMCAVCASPRINFLIFFWQFLGFFCVRFSRVPSLGNVAGDLRAGRGLAEHRGGPTEWCSTGASGSGRSSGGAVISVVVAALPLRPPVVLIVIMVMLVGALHHGSASPSEARPKR